MKKKREETNQPRRPIEGLPGLSVLSSPAKPILYLYAGPKTSFMRDKIYRTHFFLPAMKLFLQKQAAITTTMTKHFYNVFNLSF